jgi:type VII secretion-associated serine protease mycosin
MLAAHRGRMMLATGAAFAAMFAAGVPLAAGAAAAPADPVQNSEGLVLDTLNVPGAWPVSKGGGVTVAVIDSGVDPTVSDLKGSVITGPDLTGLPTKSGNPDWGEHGTWMASIIAGHGHDDGTSGIIGVAPEAKILSIRVIPDKNDPHYKKYEAEPEQTIQNSLAEGIRYAVQHGAGVISMSIGYSSPSTVVRAAVLYAYSRGAVLVASSGNSGHDDERRTNVYAPVSFPADYPGVLSVAALDGAGGVANFSSDNLSVQVAAPGVKVPAQGRYGLYWTVDGTSPACALVAGVAALIESKYPRLSPAQVIYALTSTAKNPKGGYNVRTGFGTVNAVKALDEAAQLEKEHAARSQVAASARFGGGPAAVPPAPVSPRGISQLVMFVVLAIMSLVLAIAGLWWLSVLARPRRGAHAARYSGTSGSRYAAGSGGYQGGGGYQSGSGYPGGGGYPGAG